jgi:hypothetical protein
MKFVLLAALCLALAGCEKTIHEASASQHHHITDDTRSTAAVRAFT